MGKQPFDFDCWSIRKEAVPFNSIPTSMTAGWCPDGGIRGPTVEEHEKKFKNKLFPFLGFFYVVLHNPGMSPKHLPSLNTSSQKVKDLFLKFYRPGMTHVILNTSIVARPHSRQKPFYYSEEEYIFKPRIAIKDYPKPYEFFFRDFWINNKIYNAPAVPDPFEYHEFLEDEVGIILNFWQNYLLIEKYSVMDQIDFMHFYETLRELASDILMYPLKNLPPHILQKRLKYLKSAVHPDDCKIVGINYNRWIKEAPDTLDDIYKSRITDSRDCLNSFFSQFNYSTMKNALELYLINVYESFGNELQSRKILSQCTLCRNYFLFVKDKKYCSLRSENKDCGKKARNKKYYATKGQSRLPKYRKTTRELRKFYKSKGIKK